jgi:AcrR family transcriptional regulator
VTLVQRVSDGIRTHDRRDHNPLNAGLLISDVLHLQSPAGGRRRETSIYRQFATRDELVEAVAADSFARLDGALVRAMNGIEAPADAMHACCTGYCRFGLKHPGHYQILFIAPLALDPDNRPEERPVQRVLQRLVDAVQACIARPGDSSQIATNV